MPMLATSMVKGLWEMGNAMEFVISPELLVEVVWLIKLQEYSEGGNLPQCIVVFGCWSVIYTRKIYSDECAEDDSMTDMVM
jgi:hypothetical protein